MERSELKIGDRVVVNGKKLYVRELHNEIVCGLSHTMETDPERSFGVCYKYIENILPKTNNNQPKGVK